MIEYSVNEEVIQSRERFKDKLLGILDLAEGDENYNLIYQVVYDLYKDLNNHYVALSLDNSNLISFAKTKDEMLGTRRVKTRFGRYLKRYYHLSLPDHVTEFITSSLIEDNIEQHIELLSGESIVHAYEEGRGQCSCMTGDYAHKVQIYADNPDVVQLILYNDGHKEARALLWTDTLGRKIVDRVYPNSNDMISRITSWAKMKGYLYRTHHHLPESYVRISDFDRHEVVLDWFCYDKAPYMDTFIYGYKSGSKLHLFNAITEGCDLDFRTDRGYPYELEVCCKCGCRDIYTYYNNERYCEDCAHEYLTPCPHCGEMTDYTVYHEFYDDEVCQDCIADLRECSCCNLLMNSAEAIMVDNVCYCPECIEEKGAKKCIHCGRYTFDINKVNIYNGEGNFCSQCFNQIEIFCYKCNKIGRIGKMTPYYNYYICGDHCE